MSEINLLSQKEGVVTDKGKALRIVRLTAILFLLFTALSSVILFLLNVNSGISELDQEEKGLIQNLSSYQQKQLKFLVVNDRVKSILTLAEKNVITDKIISVVAQAVPSENFFIDTLVIENKSILITVSSPSLLNMDSFISALVKEAASKKTFKKLKLDNLSFSDVTKRYNLTLSAESL